MGADVDPEAIAKFRGEVGKHGDTYLVLEFLSIKFKGVLPGHLSAKISMYTARTEQRSSRKHQTTRQSRLNTLQGSARLTMIRLLSI